MLYNSSGKLKCGVKSVCVWGVVGGVAQTYHCPPPNQKSGRVHMPPCSPLLPTPVLISFFFLFPCSSFLSTLSEYICSIFTSLPPSFFLFLFLSSLSLLLSFSLPSFHFHFLSLSLFKLFNNALNIFLLIAMLI